MRAHGSPKSRMPHHQRAFVLLARHNLRRGVAGAATVHAQALARDEERGQPKLQAYTRSRVLLVSARQNCCRSSAEQRHSGRVWAQHTMFGGVGTLGAPTLTPHSPRSAQQQQQQGAVAPASWAPGMAPFARHQAGSQHSRQAGRPVGRQASR